MRRPEGFTQRGTVLFGSRFRPWGQLFRMLPEEPLPLHVRVWLDDEEDAILAPDG